MNKFFRILEIIWLLTAIACAVISVYFLINKDTDRALYFVFVFIIWLQLAFIAVLGQFLPNSVKKNTL